MNRSSRTITFVIVFITCGLAWASEVKSTQHSIKAIAFDAFPIFDPRPIDALTIEMFPTKGKELIKLWHSRQFEYQWLRILTGNYKNFEETTEDALVFATNQLHVPLTDEARKKLMSSYDGLPVWPDVKAAISKIKAEGYKVVFLSNMTEKMLVNNLKKSGLESVFDGIYSTDSIRTFKPSTSAYQIALERLHLSREEILFVAFAGWDAAGAKWFGFPTFWVNRTDSSLEQLDNAPDGTGRDLQSLLKFLERYSEPLKNTAEQGAAANP